MAINIFQLNKPVSNSTKINPNNQRKLNKFPKFQQKME